MIIHRMNRVTREKLAGNEREMATQRRQELSRGRQVGQLELLRNYKARGDRRVERHGMDCR